MSKTILITGSTDGIGLATAKSLVKQGHRVILHGRNAVKLAQVQEELSQLSTMGAVNGFVADLSRIADVEKLADAVIEQYSQIDVLLNNAGVFRTSESINAQGLDVRFVVNTIAPYLLTKRFLPLLGFSGAGG